MHAQKFLHPKTKTMQISSDVMSFIASDKVFPYLPSKAPFVPLLFIPHFGMEFLHRRLFTIFWGAALFFFPLPLSGPC